MANLYWVGGTGTWDSGSAAHWSTTSGGAGGAGVPGTTTTAVFDANSGGGTVTLGMPLSLQTFEGITMGQFTGTLNLNGKLLRLGTFSATGTGTRTLTMGAAAVSCSIWDITISTNLTLNADTSQIGSTGNGRSLSQFHGGGMTYYNVEHGLGNLNRNIFITGSNTYNDLSVVEYDTTFGPPYYLIMAPGSTQTINGTFQCNIPYGFFGNHGRTLIRTGTIGDSSLEFISTAGITAAINAATVDIDRVDFMDIVAGGAGTWSGASIGDALGNSGITFTPAVTRYWVGNGGNWFDTAHWSTSTGGATGASVPICQDTAIFDANSFSSSGQFVRANLLVCYPSMNWSAATNSPTLTFFDYAGLFWFGNQAFNSGMTFDAWTVAPEVHFASRSAITLDMQGATLTLNDAWGLLDIDMPGGTLTLLSDLVTNLKAYFSLTRGTFNANDFDVTVARFQSSNTNIRTLNMGLGTWSLSAATAAFVATFTWDISDPTNMTLDAGGSDIIFTNNSIAYIFNGGGLTYNNLTFTGGTSKTLALNDSNTFSILTFTGPSTITLEENSVQTAATFSAVGTLGNLVTLRTSGVFGIITSIEIVDGGLGYTLGDVVLVSDGSNGRYEITAVDGSGTVTELTEVTPGTNYVSGVHNTSSTINYEGIVIDGDIVDAGSGYEVGDFVSVDGSGDAALFEVLTIGGSGEVTSIALDYGGSDYTAGVKTTSPDDSREGIILSATISNGGSGYTAGDYLYVEPGVGDPLAEEGYFLIDSVDGGGAITGISLDSGGFGYSDGVHDVTPLDFGGTGAQINLTVGHDGTGLTIDVDVNTFAMLTVDIIATTIKSYISSTNPTASYVDVKNNHAQGTTPFEDYPGGVDSGNNTNWCFTLGCSVNSFYLQTTFLVGAELGEVQTMNVGKDDDGTPIFYELETQDIEFGNRAHLKQISDQIQVLSKFGGDSQLQAIEEGREYKDIPVNLTRRVSINDKINLKGKYFNFKWFGEVSTDTPILEGIKVEKVTDLGLTNG